MTIVRMIGLPLTVRGLTIPDVDGNYNIFINKNLSHKMQLDAYLHEINHIENGDFDSYAPVYELEQRINKGA
ncbi:hypothetical protein [Desulfosporosinus sp. FKA]|uniref:hypothetical protein n=1 Tax=Desulfosporosinus sp. FKA TaxID=1969834 RepID=UPI000B49BABA|nr:hypothetical protein [Desulfosporosinus sp. FKA]